MHPFPKPGVRRRPALAADVMLGLALTLLAACGERPVTAPAAPAPGGAVQPVVTGTTTLRVVVSDAARNPVAGVAVTVVGAQGPIEPRGVTDAAGVAEFLVTSGQPVCVYAVTVDVAAYGFEAGFVPPATPADLVTPPPHGAAMTVRNGRSGPLTVQNYKTFCANPGPVTPTGSTETVRLQLVPAHRVVLSLLQPDGSLLGSGAGAAFLLGTGLQCADLPWLTAAECDALAAAQVHPGLLWSANASANGAFELYATPGQPFQIEYFLPVTTDAGSFNLLFSFQGTAGAGGATTTLGTQALEVQTCQTQTIQERSGEKKSGVDFVGPVGAGFLGTWALALRTDGFATFYQQAGSGPARFNFRIQRPGGAASTLTGEVEYTCDAGTHTCAETGADLPAGMGRVFLWRWDTATGRFAITIVLFGIPADVLEVQVSGSAPQSGDSWPDPSRAQASSAYFGVAPPTGPCASESRFDVGDV